MKLQHLFEGLSPILFHYRSLRAAASILKDNKFTLSTDLGNPTERDYRSRGKVYYLSATRSIAGAFHRDKLSGVMFKLDGRALQANHHGKAIDFFAGYDDDRERADDFEYEDRVYSNDPYINNADRYITEVHILQYDRSDTKHVREIVYHSKRRRIPVYYYTYKGDWLLLRKDKAEELPTFDRRDHVANMLPDKDDKVLKWTQRDIDAYQELFYAASLSELRSRESKELLSMIRNPSTRGKALEQLRGVLRHGARGNYSLNSRNLIQTLRRNGFNSEDDFFDELVDKVTTVLT